jgi:L-fuculose-phosphate aldolase
MTGYSVDSIREQTLREEVVRVGRLLYEKGLVVAGDGNISVRLTDHLILATPGGLCKGMLQPDQLIITDLQGGRVGLETAASRELKPTSEMCMHLEVYRQRPDVQAVVHAHPPTTIALSIAGISLAECLLPEVIVTLGIIPTTEYATPSSDENAHAIRNLIVNHDGIVLKRHGALTVGTSLMDAFHKMETIEHLSRIKLMLVLLGRGEPLPPFQVEKLLELRRKLGLNRPGEELEFREICGVGREN